MKCDELKLFSYIEGISSSHEKSEMEDHLRSCDKCRQKLDRLKFTIETFTQYYAHHDRGSCPSGEEIILFKYGQMDKDQANSLNKHIKECSTCQEDLLMIERFEKTEDRVFESAMDAHPLSDEIISKIEQLKKESIRDRFEKVLRSFLEKGKDRITPEKIPELLDHIFAPAQTTVPVYALPSDATLSDTQITLREFSPLTDITFDIREYQISIKSRENSLVFTVHQEKRPIKGVKIMLGTESFKEIKVVTGPDGTCAIENVPGEPSRIKIHLPD